MEPIYSLNNIEVRLGEKFSLNVPLLEINEQKIHVVTGPNGAGKSTLLRVLALLLKPQQGTLFFSGKLVKHEQNHLLSLRRKITLVEQSPYLLQSSVYNNLVFGLKVRNVSHEEQQERIFEVLKMVGLPDFARRQTKNLSGGEIQRVALARALVLRPNVLLLDEPTANIDFGSLAGFEKLLHNLSATGMTIVLTTHDPDQAKRLQGHLMTIETGVVQSKMQTVAI